MKQLLTFGLLLVILIPRATHAQDKNLADSLSRKQLKQLRKTEFRQNNKRYFFNVGIVYASLQSGVEFDFLDGLLSAKLSLEDNLGLPSRRAFITSSFIYRFNRNSGIYANYYGINRTKTYTAERDLIFLEDTIAAGSAVNAFFNTRVVSVGYLQTLKQDQNTFLGFYFNLYLMWLKTGVSSDIGALNAEVNFAAPLPNFGLVAMFTLYKWLHLDGNVGFFALNTKNLGGTLFDFNLGLTFKPTQWLGISVSYQEFDIRLGFPENSIYTTVDYNFRGPALGLHLIL